MNAKEIREILEDEIPGSGLWRNQNDNYWDRAMDRIADRILAKSKEEAEDRYYDAINWTKVRNMEYPGNLEQSLHIASGRLAAFGKEGEG